MLWRSAADMSFPTWHKLFTSMNNDINYFCLVSESLSYVTVIAFLDQM